MNDLLIFSKERTIGQVISFAFLIFRKNIRNFWKGLAAAVLPWILAAIVLIAPYIIATTSGSIPNLDGFVALMLLSIILFMLGFLVLNTYVNEYVIAVKNDVINQQPHYKGIVKATYKAVPKNILNFILCTFLVFLMTSVLGSVMYVFILILAAFSLSGSVFLIGVGAIAFNLGLAAVTCYLFACTGPIIFISQYEKVNFFKALEINFSYVHGRKGFWTAILVTFFGFILMLAVAMNITEPIWIIYGVFKYNSGTMGSMSSSAATNVVGMAYLTLLACMPVSSFMMMLIFGSNYFSQKEKAVGTGVNERIAMIGSNKDYDSAKLEANF